MRNRKSSIRPLFYELHRTSGASRSLSRAISIHARPLFYEPHRTSGASRSLSQGSSSGLRSHVAPFPPMLLSQLPGAFAELSHFFEHTLCVAPFALLFFLSSCFPCSACSCLFFLLISSCGRTVNERISREQQFLERACG